jgi:CBS domain containing-hemolysin-like protein
MPSYKRYGLLLRVTSRVLKYYLLAVAGFTIACLLSVVFGIPGIAVRIVFLLGGWVWRLAIMIVCSMAIAMLIESIRE